MYCFRKFQIWSVAEMSFVHANVPLLGQQNGPGNQATSGHLHRLYTGLRSCDRYPSSCTTLGHAHRLLLARRLVRRCVLAIPECSLHMRKSEASCHHTAQWDQLFRGSVIQAKAPMLASKRVIAPSVAGVCKDPKREQKRQKTSLTWQATDSS